MSPGDVQRVGEVGGKLDRRVHGERAADAAAQAGALQEGRRLDRPAADEDVAGVDRDGRAVGVGDQGAGGPAAVAHEAVDAVPARSAGAGASARGRYVSVMLWRRPSMAASPGVRHPARDLVVAPAEARPRRAAARRSPASRRRARAAQRGRCSTSSQIRTSSSDSRSATPCSVAPPVHDVLGRPTVEAAVDLRAAADAAALGVGDRGEAEGGGHPAGAVLAVHLGERERDDLALGDVGPLLGDEHVEAGLGEQRGSRSLRRRPTR